MNLNFLLDVNFRMFMLQLNIGLCIYITIFLLQFRLAICEIVNTKCDPRIKKYILLMQKKIYKDQAENMLVNHVFPEFANEHGYLRARVRVL